MRFRKVLDLRTGLETNTVQCVATGAFYSKQSTEYVAWAADPENELDPPLDE